MSNKVPQVKLSHPIRVENPRMLLQWMEATLDTKGEELRSSLKVHEGFLVEMTPQPGLDPDERREERREHSGSKEQQEQKQRQDATWGAS